MTNIILYGYDFSPPVRACLITLKALSLPYEYVRFNVFEREHMSEKYLKKNPQHTVPFLEDDGNCIWDSHAIMAYLVSKYGKDDSLYPKDLLKRAHVDQRLYFDSGVMFQGALRNITAPLFIKQENQIPQHKVDAITEAYNFLEIFLKDTPYVAGNNLTISDFSSVTTVTSLAVILEIDSVKYPKITAWIKRVKALPYYAEVNESGDKMLLEMVAAANLTFVP